MKNQVLFSVHFTLLLLFSFLGKAQPWPPATWTSSGACTGNEPEIVKVFIDPCSAPDGQNEFIYVKTGTSGWNYSSFNMNGGSTQPPLFPATNFQPASTSIINNLNGAVGTCSSGTVFFAGTNPIPANATVMVFPCGLGTSTTANSAPYMCGKGPIYVIAGDFVPSSSSGGAFFRNGAISGGSNKTTEFNFGACKKTLVYNNSAPSQFPPDQGPPGSSSAAYILGDGQIGTSGCLEIPGPCTAPPNPIITNPTISICEAQPVTTTFNCSNCTGNVSVYTSNISLSPIYTGTSFPPPNFSPPTVTTTYYVEQSGLCPSGRVPITIQINSAPQNILNAPTTLTCTNPTVTISGNISTGTNFLYTWSGPSGFSSTGLNPVVNQVGAYSLTVTNITTGCTKVANTTVSENTMPPTISSITPVTVNCFTPSPMLTANATGSNLIYNWSPTNQITPNITVVSGGTYTVTVTNAINGCIASTSTTVPEDKIPPVVSVTASGTLSCQNNTVVLNTAGTSTSTNFTYNWSGPNNFSSTALTPPAVSVAGSYSLTVTNTINGCTVSASTVVLSNNNNVTANAGADQTIGCGILQATIGTVAVAGNTYTWSNGSTNATQIVTSAGIYYLTVTNPASGCTATDNVIVTANNTPPIAQINSSTSLVLTCTNPTTTLTASGGVSYSWGNGISIQSISVTNAGTYQVTVTSQNGCTSTSTVLVSEDKIPPTINIATPSVLTCTNPTVTLNASGSSTGANFTYNWSTTNGNFVSSNTNLTTMVDKAGVYNLLITNTANGCNTSSSIAVTANNTLPMVSIATPGLLTCQSQTVQLYAIATLGTNITFNWTTNGGNFVSGQNTLSPTVSKAGTYTLVVTDNTTGCSKSASVIVINDANIPIANAGPDQVLTCNQNIVLLDGTGTSAGANFTYFWSTANTIVTGASTPFPLVNQVGTYTLFVTNTTNGCSASDAVLVTQAMPPTVAIGSNSPACVGSTLTLSASGANTYQWTGVNNFTSSSSSVSISNVTASNAGVYTVVATNTVTGCSASVSTTVQVQNAYVTAYDIVLMRAGTSRTYNLKPAILKANPKIIGNPIPKSIKISYSLPGNYSVKVPYIIDSTGCSGLVVLFIKVIKNGVGTKPINLDDDSDNELSLEMEIERQKVTVFPNPSEGVFQINVPKSLKSYQTQVFDVNGKIILTGENTNEIDLNNFSNGIYFLKIKNEDVEETVKLIKI